MSHEKRQAHRDAVQHHENASLGASFGHIEPADTTQDLSRVGLGLMLDSMAVPDLGLEDTADDFNHLTDWDAADFGLSADQVGKSLIAEALRGFLDDDELSEDEEEERSDEDEDGRASLRPTGKSIMFRS